MVLESMSLQSVESLGEYMRHSKATNEVKFKAISDYTRAGVLMNSVRGKIEHSMDIYAQKVYEGMVVALADKETGMLSIKTLIGEIERVRAYKQRDAARELEQARLRNLVVGPAAAAAAAAAEGMQLG